MRTPKDFQRVLREGNRRSVGGIIVTSATGQEGPPRVGLTVSKAVGNAVTRNRIKRRLRHTVRDVGLPSGRDYVIIARKSVAEVSYSTLLEWLDRAVNTTDHA